MYLNVQVMAQSMTIRRLTLTWDVFKLEIEHYLVIRLQWLTLTWDVFKLKNTPFHLSYVYD